MGESQKAAARPTPRIVPGAPPSAAVPAASSATTSATSSKSKKRNKKPQGDGTAPTESLSGDTKVEDAKQAATVAAIPDPAAQVTGSGLKVQAKDLQEQAEKSAAVAAVQVVQDKQADVDSFGIQRGSVYTLINKRLKNINKKLQRVTTYESQPQETLNADQKRILTTKPVLVAVKTELQDILAGFDAAEKEDTKAIEAGFKEKLEIAKEAASKETSEQMITLLQFLHLFALFNPQLLSHVDSFAPPSLPSIFQENVTGQEVAALGKIFEQLALGPLEASTAASVAGQSEGAMEVVSKLRNVHEEGEVVHGVGYARVREMIHQLINPVTEPASHSAPAFGGELPEEQASGELEAIADAGHDDAAPAAVAAPILTFGTVDEDVLSSAAQKAAQGDSLTEAETQLDAPEVDPEEPEGGAPDAEQTAGTGIIMGSTEATQSAFDGSANAQVDEPVTTQEVHPSSEDAQDASAQIVDPAAPAQLSWAEEMEEESKAEETPDAVAAEPNSAAPAAPLQPSNASNSKNGKQRTPGQVSAPKPKPQPQVDEDGFTVMASKRTLQQQERGRGRGRGRGGPARGGSNANTRGGSNFSGRQRSEGGSDATGAEGQAQSGRGSGRGRPGNGATRGQPGRGRGKPETQRADEAPTAPAS